MLCNALVFARLNAKVCISFLTSTRARSFWGFRPPDIKHMHRNMVQFQIWMYKWICTSNRNSVKMRFQFTAQTKTVKIDVFKMIWVIFKSDSRSELLFFVNIDTCKINVTLPLYVKCSLTNWQVWQVRLFRLKSTCVFWGDLSETQILRFSCFWPVHS